MVGPMLNHKANLNARQREQYTALERIASRYGKWDTSTGPDGAHYAPAEANPFVSEGLICGNCAFYEAGQCELVTGPLAGGAVAANGVCKHWIIPGVPGVDEQALAAGDLLVMLAKSSGR